MKKHLINWAISIVAIMVAAYLIPGVYVSGVFTALVVAVVLGLLNIFIRPIILILTLPINILTLGLFTLVINAGIVLLAGKIVDGFVVSEFWTALIFGLVLSLVNSVFHIKKD
ncbi:MAG: phage holin family protein [Candidatus Moranbacteria bacterium]|jgi:putative membrane protein|nr:phage holin family protein [Candidatus Moranbacteria bacterium]